MAEPAWSPLGDAGMPLGGRQRSPQIAGGRGYVLLQPAFDGIDLRESSDGGSWRPTTPYQFDPIGPIADLAGSADGVFLLGTVARQSSPAVWKFADGAWGSPALVDSVAGNVFDGGDKPTATKVGVGGADNWAVAAGPAGVLVVDDEPDSLRLWLSRNGDSFSAHHLRLENMDRPEHATPVRVAPTSDGFIVAIGDRIVTVAADGTPAEVEVAGLPAGTVIDGIAVRGDRMAAFGLSHTRLRPGDAGYDAGREEIGGNERSAVGAWCGPLPTDSLTFRSADMDPGRLPDAGVVRRGAFPLIISEYAGGFLLAGNTLTIDIKGKNTGALWQSADGCGWTKQPVAANGFDQVDSLLSIASTSNGVLLMGAVDDARESFSPRFWFSGAGSPPRTAAPTTPPDPVPPAGNNGEGGWSGTVSDNSGTTHDIVLSLTGPPSVGQVVGSLVIDADTAGSCIVEAVLAEVEGNTFRFRKGSVQGRLQRPYCPATFTTEANADGESLDWTGEGGFSGKLRR